MAPKKAMAGMKPCICSRKALGRLGVPGGRILSTNCRRRFHISGIVTDPAQIYLGFMHGFGHVLLDSLPHIPRPWTPASEWQRARSPPASGREDILHSDRGPGGRRAAVRLRERLALRHL